MGWFKPSNAATLLAVLCQDRPSQGNMEAWKAQYEQTQELSPTFGARAINFDMTCAAWGHYSASDPIPQDVHAEGAPPILVVGATGDPATPYHWSEALAEQLDSGHLLTWEGNAMVLTGTKMLGIASPQPSTVSSWTASCLRMIWSAPAESGRLPLIESCCLRLLARRQHDFYACFMAGRDLGPAGVTVSTESQCHR